MLARRTFLCSSVALLAWAGFTTAAPQLVRGPRTSWTLLTGGYTTTISTLTFNISAGTITVDGSADAGANPSWIALNPANKSIVYATNENDVGAILSFTTDSSAKLVSEVKSADSNGAAPAHLSPIRGGSQIMVMNYNSGTGASYTLSADKLSFSNELTIGPFPANVSHPHMVYEHGYEVLIPDLGADEIWRLVQSSSGWTIAGSIPQPTGSGPRHIQTKGSVVFVLHELANTLESQVIPLVPSNDSTTTTISSLSVLPPDIPGDIYDGRFHAAEVILSPDGKYLYASNRDTSTTPDPRGDAIAIVSVASDGSLTLITHVFTGLQLLRGLSLSPDGKYIAGGGQQAGGVAIYEIVSGGADLEEVARDSDGPAATSFVWLK